ncbi:MAG TPA: phosphate signaling complex protein PhoU [Spirochaetia bacterium]
MKGRLVTYGRFVQDMIEKSRKALATRQAGLLDDIISRDEPRANESEMDLEEECTSLIAQHQPMARDLRTILMILRITNGLERIADHAVNIAEAVSDHVNGSPPDPDPEIMEMFDETIRMLDDSMRAFLEEDAALGLKVCESDNAVDARATAILDRLSSSMPQDPQSIPRSLAVLKISANLERVADISTNIGEDVIYMTEGRVIKHHRQDAQ